MPRRPSRARRLTTATRWPVGIALTSWNYMWRTTPLHRSEEITGEAPDPPPLPRREEVPGGAPAPPPPPADVDREELQPPADGAGPYFHRVFRTRIRET